LISCDLPGDLCGRKIDIPGPVRQSVGGEFQAVGGERIRLDHVHPGIDVFLVDRLDQRGLGDAEFIIAGVNKDAALIDHGAHGTIKDQRLAA